MYDVSPTRWRGALALLLALGLACAGQDPSSAPSPEPIPEPTAEPGLDLSALEGTWYALAQHDGLWTSRDWCDADRRSLQLAPGRLVFGYGQEADVQVVLGERAEAGGVLVVEARGDYEGSTPTTHRIQRAEAGVQPGGLRVAAGGVGEEWLVARRQDLEDRQFLRSCCAGPEGDIPSEYALVPEGSDCPTPPPLPPG